MTDIFNKVSVGVLDSLENRLISDEFLNTCNDALNELKIFQQKAMQHPDPINAVKLFSASDTCYLVLQKSIEELEQAKQRGENPTTLERIEEVFLHISNIGRDLDYLFNRNVGVEITRLRNNTFELQEKAEKLGLLDKIDERVNSLSDPLKKAYILRAGRPF
jgi:hypothetical protein